MALPNLNPAVNSGPWKRGINSIDDPIGLTDDHVQWSVNTMNRGGVYQTRPRFKALTGMPFVTNVPRGIKLFTPVNKEPVLVVAIGTNIIITSYPFEQWSVLPNVRLDESILPVSMEIAVKGTITDEDGTLEILGDSSYPVLIIQCRGGKVKPIVWDGIKAFHSDTVPVFDHMKWIGNRLWGAKDNLLRASNILDPLLFTEEDFDAEGGIFILPAPITGLGATVDQQSLLAFTSITTTSFQAGILQRVTWLSTKDFKKVLLADIGCVAANTIINQYGMLWWMSQKGLIALDNALQTYRSSKIKVKDRNMARSKWNLSGDTSRSCAGTFGNVFLLSVPSGDTHNAHTWVMDEEIVDLIDENSPAEWSSIWTGIRPVEWATGEVHGQTRCFVLSRNYPRASDPLELFSAGVWEAFCGQGPDLGLNGLGVVVQKNIQCSMETKFLGYGLDYKEFGFADIELNQIQGSVHLDVYYASPHSGYKRVLSKNIIATSDSLKFGVALTDVNSYLPQSRAVRTSNDVAQLSDLDPGIELGLTRNKSRSYSLLLKWSGQAAIRKVTLFTHPSGDQVEGRVEQNETTVRYILPSGAGTVGTTGPVASSLISGLTTQNIVTLSPRWTEDFYQSNT